MMLRAALLAACVAFDVAMLWVWWRVAEWWVRRPVDRGHGLE